MCVSFHFLLAMSWLHFRVISTFNQEDIYLLDKVGSNFDNQSMIFHKIMLLMCVESREIIPHSWRGPHPGLQIFVRNYLVAMKDKRALNPSGYLVT
jgi:hypothetical protein